MFAQQIDREILSDILDTCVIAQSDQFDCPFLRLLERYFMMDIVLLHCVILIELC